MGRHSHYAEKKHLLLKAVFDANRTHSKVPSVRELANLVGSSVGATHLYLDQLEGEGLIVRDRRKRRGLRCTPLTFKILSRGSQSTEPAPF